MWLGQDQTSGWNVLQKPRWRAHRKSLKLRTASNSAFMRQKEMFVWPLFRSRGREGAAFSSTNGLTRPIYCQLYRKTLPADFQ
jgi:hypothetical protein